MADRWTPEHGYAISSPDESDDLVELKMSTVSKPNVLSQRKCPELKGNDQRLLSKE